MNRKEFRSLCDSGIVILDGATGTEMIRRGMPRGVCPEKWASENFSCISDIHNAYIAAGSNILYAPTFGANEAKLAEYGLEDETDDLNRRLVEMAKANAGDRALIFGDMAPTGMIFAPAGPLELERAVEIFRRQAAALVAGGADGIVIETMIDFSEARAALLAVREIAPDLPVMLTMTFEPGGLTLSGNPPEACLITAQALRADAFGCNCSCGPEAMLPIISRLKEYAVIPLAAKPNAGMPKLVRGATVFSMTPEEFGANALKLAEAGVNIAGGCCGTSPEHIAALSRALSGVRPLPPRRRALSAVSSAGDWHVWRKGAPITVIGERINPTGKKALQAELRQGSFDTVRRFAREQEKAGAHILDINMGLSGIDEKTMMLQAIDAVSGVSRLPLCIDSGSPEVTEAALRKYPGRALVNSVTAEKERITATLRAAAKYGAMIIVLPVAESGIPADAAGRAACIREIFAAAEECGYAKEDIIIDALTMTVSADPGAPGATLETVEWAAGEFGCHVLLGLSNVSFGMPERERLNAAMLTMAAARGLDTAILNPSLPGLRLARLAADALLGRDDKLKAYLSDCADRAGDADEKATGRVAAAPPATGREALFHAILEGTSEDAVRLVGELLASGEQPGELLDGVMIPAIREVGERFGSGKLFLPQLIMSADAMRAGADVLSEAMAAAEDGKSAKPKFVIATVKDDIHDIGKNIAALLLRNYGFDVIDLGKDVAAETVVQCLRESGSRLLGLSALMTTTMPRMQETVEAVRASGLGDVKIVVGGAAVDETFAESIGVAYSATAMDAVNWALKNV